MSRVQMSAAQFALFKQQAGKPRATGTQRVQKRRAELPENIVTSQVIGFLRAHGWVCSRQQSGLFCRPFAAEHTSLWEKIPRVRVGEKGCPDWRAEKPIRVPAACDASRQAVPHWLMYLELKAPGRKPTPQQLAWLEKRRMCGTPAEWFNSFDVFQEWYVRMFGGK